jgi:hypothetical protein
VPKPNVLTRPRAGPGEPPAAAEAGHDDGPTPSQVEALHALAALPPVCAPAPEGLPVRRWRVRLKGCLVNVLEPMRGVHVRQDYLDVSAAGPAGAVAEFGRHNGIPLVRDPLTGEVRLASIHRPDVEPLPE